MAERDKFDDVGFVEPEEDFAEDDLFTPEDGNMPCKLISFYLKFIEYDHRIGKCENALGDVSS